jgi:hypothetical protein
MEREDFMRFASKMKAQGEAAATALAKEAEQLFNPVSRGQSPILPMQLPQTPPARQRHPRRDQAGTMWCSVRV